MQEYQLVQRIKKLRQIKPDRDWVSLTKSQILARGKEVKTESWLFTPIKKPAFIVAPLILVAAALGGLFIYLNFLPQSSSPPVITQGFLAKVSENQKEKEQEKQIVASLKELRVSLEQATADLNKLRESRDTRKALQMAEVVKIVARQVEGTIDQIKTPNIQSEEVLASLNEVKDNSQELEQAAENVRIAILIEYLSRRSLTKGQENFLREAEEYYDNGEYNEALSKALRASQVR